MPAEPRLRVAFACDGLGFVERGYETTTAAFADALRERPDLGIEATLYSGGPFPGAVPLGLPAGVVRLLRRRLPRRDHDLNQYAFAAELAWRLWRDRPAVLWTKRAWLARVVRRARALLGFETVIVLANGGLDDPRSLRGIDFIQQLHPEKRERALRAGLPDERMEVLANLVRPMRPTRSRAATRQALGLEPDDFVVISVAAWIRSYKRLDYVIDEVAAIDDPSVKLLLVGQDEPGSGGLVDLGRRRLGSRVKFLTLPHDQIPDALTACDVFVLATLEEGFGQAILEARVAGVPIVAHPHGGSRYILEDDPRGLCDLSRRGALARRLAELRAHPPDAPSLQDSAARALERFGPTSAVDRFAALLRRAQALGPLAGGRRGPIPP